MAKPYQTTIPESNEIAASSVDVTHEAATDEGRRQRWERCRLPARFNPVTAACTCATYSRVLALQGVLPPTCSDVPWFCPRAVETETPTL